MTTNTFDNFQNKRTEQAARTYLARQQRHAHPDGAFDGSMRWYPSEAESQPCCDAIRAPSRRWPLSLNVHARSVRHVAHLYNVDARALRRAVRAQQRESISDAAQLETHHSAIKGSGVAGAPVAGV